MNTQKQIRIALLAVLGFGSLFHGNATEPHNWHPKSVKTAPTAPTPAPKPAASVVSQTSTPIAPTPVPAPQSPAQPAPAAPQPVSVVSQTPAATPATPSWMSRGASSAKDFLSGCLNCATTQWSESSNRTKLGLKVVAAVAVVGVGYKLYKWATKKPAEKPAEKPADVDVGRPYNATDSQGKALQQQTYYQIVNGQNQVKATLRVTDNPLTVSAAKNSSSKMHELAQAELVRREAYLKELTSKLEELSKLEKDSLTLVKLEGQALETYKRQNKKVIQAEKGEFLPSIEAEALQAKALQVQQKQPQKKQTSWLRWPSWFSRNS